MLFYAIWSPDGTVRRAFSLSPDSGVIENVGTPLPFEKKYLAGDQEFLASLDEDDPDLGEIVPAGYAVTAR